MTQPSNEWIRYMTDRSQVQSWERRSAVRSRAELKRRRLRTFALPAIAGLCVLVWQTTQTTPVPALIAAGIVTLVPFLTVLVSD